MEPFHSYFRGTIKKEINANSMGRIPIFPVMPLALDCVWLPSVSDNSNALL
jgi:hypothetical protein